MYSKPKHTQRGVGATVVIGTILIVLCIAAVGIAVWHKNHAATKQTSSQNNTNKTPTTPKSDTPSSPTYLTITEWNLRFTLTGQLAGDINYVADHQAEKDFGGPVKIDLSSKQFSAGTFKCADVDTQPRVLISFYKEVDGQGVVTQDPQPFKRIGDNRYYFSTTGCEEAIARSGSAADKQLLADLKQAVTTTLEATN